MCTMTDSCVKRVVIVVPFDASKVVCEARFSFQTY